MEWLRSNVFGGVGVSDEQLQHNSAADEDVPSSSAAASPSPRLRKRNKRDEAGVNSNYEEDSNDDNDNYDNFVSGLLGRRLNFTSHDNTSDHEEEEDDDDDEVHNNKSTDGSEEDALNTTIDTVENPVVEDVNDEEDDDCSGEAGGEERVYVNNDAMERPHVQMDKAHWRDMLWDPIKNQFYYPSSGVEPPDGIPAADGYRIVPPSDADMQVRVVFNLSRDIIMASYDEEVEQLQSPFCTSESNFLRACYEEDAQLSSVIAAGGGVASPQISC